MEDISQAPQESTNGELPHGKEPKQFKDIAKKKKVGSTKKKQRRGKVLKPFKEIAKKEKVGRRKKKLPLKSSTPEQLCEFYTPEELCEVYTSDELRRTFGLRKLHEMLPRDKLALMVFPRPVYRLLRTQDGKLIQMQLNS